MDYNTNYNVGLYHMRGVDHESQQSQLVFWLMVQGPHYLLPKQNSTYMY
jgi:hypothetical protein